MNYQNQLSDLIVEIHSAKFENANLRLDNFLEKNPGILEDLKLREEILLLRARFFKQNGEIQEALDIYLKIWEGYSVQTMGYLTVGFIITQLYFQLSKTESGMSFAKNMLKAMKIHGFQNFNLSMSISLVRIIYSFNESDPIVQSYIIFAKKELGLPFESRLEVKELADLEKKLLMEGRILTQIMATLSSKSEKDNYHNLEEFLKTAINPTLRQEAINYMDYLKDKLQG